MDLNARNYDPTIGRFFNIHPLSEATISLTVYHYGQNNPIYWKDPTGLMAEGLFSEGFTTRYTDKDTGELIEDIDDGIDQTVKVDKSQFDYMKDKAKWMGLDLSDQTDAFLFSMLYERWSEVQGTSIKFQVSEEDPDFNAEKKDNFYINVIDIDKTTQKATLTFVGEAPVNLPKTTEISTGAKDAWTPNGEFNVWWRSPNKSSNMSLNTYPDAVFAVKFNNHVATHYYNCPGYPASHGCARIKTRWFAGMIWTFSKVKDTKVNVSGIHPSHKKKK